MRICTFIGILSNSIWKTREVDQPLLTLFIQFQLMFTFTREIFELISKNTICTQIVIFGYGSSNDYYPWNMRDSSKIILPAKLYCNVPNYIAKWISNAIFFVARTVLSNAIISVYFSIYKNKKIQYIFWIFEEFSHLPYAVSSKFRSKFLL